MEDILIPIFICVVLPVAIVLIISLTKIKTDNLRTQIIIRAIEANKDVDTAKLLESMKKPQQTARDILYVRLLRGCIFTLIGLFSIILGICTLADGEDFSSDPVYFSAFLGGVSLAIGISYLIVYFATRNSVNDKEQE